MTARILVICNQKGGVGKTTVTMHIAAILHRRHQRVLVVDADPQGTATRWAAAAPDDGPFPAAVVGLASAGGKLHREIKKFLRDYDAIVVDCPPAADSPVPQSALLVADLAIVPLVPSPLDLWAAVGIKQIILAAQDINEGLVARLLLNQVQSATALARDVEAVLPEFGIPLLDTRLTQRQSYRQAAAFGSSVLEMGHRATQAIGEVKALGKEVLQLLYPTTPATAHPHPANIAG